MFQGLVNIPKSNSFFLFGARGTGKSTLLRNLFPLTSEELGPDFDEQDALRWGPLPRIWNTKVAGE